jgi:hypothetical protein
LMLRRRGGLWCSQLTAHRVVGRSAWAHLDRTGGTPCACVAFGILVVLWAAFADREGHSRSADAACAAFGVVGEVAGRCLILVLRAHGAIGAHSRVVGVARAQFVLFAYFARPARHNPRGLHSEERHEKQCMQVHLRYWCLDSLIGIGSCSPFSLGFHPPLTLVAKRGGK